MRMGFPVKSESKASFLSWGRPQFDLSIYRAADDRILVDGEGVYPCRMPFEGPYAFPLEGPNFDRSVARSADDGILVDGECVYWSRMPFEGPYAFSLKGP